MNDICFVCGKKLKAKGPSDNYSADIFECEICGRYIIELNVFDNGKISDTKKKAIKEFIINNKEKLKELEKKNIYPHFVNYLEKGENHIINGQYFILI